MKNKNNVSFSELLLWTNKSILEVGLLCGKSERTIKEYLKSNKPCLACKTLLLWFYYGVPQIDPWDDWKLRNGNLISPSDELFGPKHLEMIPILHEWKRLQEAEFNKKKIQANERIKKMKFCYS